MFEILMLCGLLLLALSQKLPEEPASNSRCHSHRNGELASNHKGPLPSGPSLAQKTEQPRRNKFDRAA